MQEFDPSSAALVVLYSVVDKASFQKAEQDLQRLQEQGLLRNRATIIVANKVDLARSRAVSTQGKHPLTRSVGLGCHPGGAERPPTGG